MIRILTIAGVVWREMLRRRDFYVLLILLGALLFSLMSINVFGLGSTMRYMVDTGLLLAWIFSAVLAVTLSARQLPAEEQRGTIFALLAKPVTRWQLLAGKALGAWSAVSAATAAFYALLLAVLALKGWSVDLTVTLQALVLHVTALAMAVSLALAVSTRTTFGAAASLTWLALAAGFVFVPQIPALLVYSDRVSGAAMLVLYYALPHFELFDLRQCVVHDWPALPANILFPVLCYGLLVTAIFMLLAWLGYRGRHFKRGDVL
ncbi:MAG TPA: ABC transporter permease subunit [Kiritimatiellia bacterium]|nr:ABC transporter permease subunit [Kiritimatiellia bacterium]HNS80134.1 ABC transporter permease subunit [Kiritimatiellia bacterium]HPA77555.1 ABC transporter permease subunit [Kiritimatiellia bacterium]HQQ04197.1 ABC transporter permease subunit [Kiritimatiellia bacterium]